MNILVVEDDIVQLNGITSILEITFPNMHLFKASDYESAISIIDRETINIFILDIDLGNNDEYRSGISLGEYIRSKQEHSLTPILYLTALRDKATTAIHETHCFDYLTKPYDQQMLIASINSLISSPLMTHQPIRLKGCDGVFFHILPQDILYIHSEGRIMHIHTKNRQYKTASMRFEKLLETLPEYIIQCQKSYAVNKNNIESIDKINKLISLYNSDELIPIGKKYLESC